MTTTLSQLLSRVQITDATLSLEVPADWMQGRSVFGGLQAALAVRAMRALVPDAPLRTLQTTFIAPVSGTVHARATILRRGKSATHVEARLLEGDTTQALMIGVFGTPRSSQAARVHRPNAIDISGPPIFERTFDGEGLAAFTRHFHIRRFTGQSAFVGGNETSQVLEIAIDDPGHATESHVIAIADFMPPIAFSLLSAPAPGSTLTWMLEFLIDRFDHLPTKGFRVEAEMVAARDGYTNQAVSIFGPGGEPIALSHQTMLVFG